MTQGFDVKLIAKKAIIATSLKVCLRVTDRHFEHLLHSKWLTCHYWPTLNVCMFSPPCSVWSSMSNQQWRLQSPVSALTWRRIQVCLSHRLHLVRWQRAVPVQLHGQPGFIYWIYVFIVKMWDIYSSTADVYNPNICSWGVPCRYKTCSHGGCGQIRQIYGVLDMKYKCSFGSACRGILKCKLHGEVP